LRSGAAECSSSTTSERNLCGSRALAAWRELKPHSSVGARQNVLLLVGGAGVAKLPMPNVLLKGEDEVAGFASGGGSGGGKSISKKAMTR